MSGRPWTEYELAFLRTHYKRARTKTICNCLNRTVKKVYMAAFVYGVTDKKQTPIKDNHAAFLHLYRLGWSDAEIADAMGVSRKGVGSHRISRGLPSNGRNARYRRRVAIKTQEQCRQAGVTTLAEVRAIAFRRFAEASGWPADLRPRHVQILNLLYDVGPMTRKQLADAMGLRWRMSRRMFKSQDPEGSYTAHLLRRGLIVSLGKIHKGQGSGHSSVVYAIPPHIQRGTA